MKREILGLALAGGKGRRMGRDKAMLSFHGGQTQLDYTLALLGTFCSKVAISGPEEQRSCRKKESEAAFIPDEAGVSGPMSGVIAGLRNEESWPVLVMACDLPLVDGSLVLRLLSQRNSQKRATCFVALDGRPEPLLAIYEASALKELRVCAEKGMFSLRRFLEEADVEKVSCREPHLIASVNTLEDLERVREQLTRSKE